MSSVQRVWFIRMERSGLLTLLGAGLALQLACSGNASKPAATPDMRVGSIGSAGRAEASSAGAGPTATGRMGATSSAGSGATAAGGAAATAAVGGAAATSAAAGAVGATSGSGVAGAGGASEAAGASGMAEAAAGASGADSTAPQPTCPASKLAPGDSSHQLQSGNHMRSYLMHVPPQYTGETPVPLLFDFHGYSSNAQQQMGGSGFRELADQEGFIAVYPEGVGASWHVNGCCGQAAQEKLDEIAFVRAIFDEVKQAACIDLEHVYASGISQGGGMAHHVACLAADIFAGVAPVSSDLRTDPCTPARPVTEISFRGLADTLDAYEGGHVGPPGMEGYTAIGAKPTLEKWKTIDMCTGTTEMMDDVCETYSNCQDGVAVSLCSIPGANHVLYQNPQGLDVPKVAWAFFMQHQRH